MELDRSMKSSARNMFIPNSEAVQVIETDVFEGSPESTLAVVRVGAESVIKGDNPVSLGYSRFRAKVYIDQTGMISESHRGIDGGERDKDDIRSIHFVGLENRGFGRAAITSSMRLIVKSEQFPDELPLEDFFRGELNADDFGYGSFEVSRYISRNDNRRNALMSKIAVIGAGVSYSLRSGLGPSYGVVEPPVERDLGRIMPLSRVSEPKLVEEYNDINTAIRLDIDEYARRAGESVMSSMYLPGVFEETKDAYYFGDI